MVSGPPGLGRLPCASVALPCASHTPETRFNRVVPGRPRFVSLHDTLGPVSQCSNLDTSASRRLLRNVIVSMRLPSWCGLACRSAPDIGAFPLSMSYADCSGKLRDLGDTGEAGGSRPAGARRAAPQLPLRLVPWCRDGFEYPRRGQGGGVVSPQHPGLGVQDGAELRFRTAALQIHANPAPVHLASDPPARAAGQRGDCARAASAAAAPSAAQASVDGERVRGHHRALVGGEIQDACAISCSGLARRPNRVSVAVRRPDDDDRAGGVLGHLGGDRPHR